MALGDILYRATPSWSRLAANATGTNKFLRSVSAGVPSWESVSKSDVGLGNVDNVSEATIIAAAAAAILPIDESEISLSNNTTNNVSITKHGFTPILPNDATKYLDGTGAYSVPPGTAVGTVTVTGTPSNGNLTKFSGGTSITNGDLSGDVTTSGTLVTTIANNAVTTVKIIDGAVTEAKQTLADNTTNNVTSTQHGYAPKSPGDATKFLNGAATPAYALVKDSDLSTSDITTNDVVSTKHGFAPKSPGDSTKFLNGGATPAWSVPTTTRTIRFTFNDMTVGSKVRLSMPVAGTIISSRIFSDVSGSAVVDIWKIAFASYPPAIGNTITASAKPTLSSQIAVEDTTLTGWTTSFSAGDVFFANMDSNSGVTQVVVELKVTV